MNLWFGTYTPDIFLLLLILLNIFEQKEFPGIYMWLLILLINKNSYVFLFFYKLYRV